MTGEEFRAAVAPLARRIARQGTTWFLPLPTWARVLVFLLGLVVLSLVAGLRGAVCGGTRASSTTTGPASGVRP